MKFIQIYLTFCIHYKNTELCLKKSKTIVETAIERVPNFGLLCQNIERNFKINGRSKSTLTNYQRCLAHLALHYLCSPEQLDLESINDYLYFCKSQHNTPSDSFFKHTIYGLRTAYKVSGLTEKAINLPQIEGQKDLPIVLNKTEIKALLKAPKYLKHRLILGMLYGCGLRNYELCGLRLQDVDFERKTVFIKHQKGKNDRIVPLSDLLQRGLKNYISTEYPEHFLFNSQVVKNGKKQGMTTNGVAWIVKESRTKVNTHKKITAHVLRHTYATHLLEEGVNIMRLKDLLGHVRVETTLIYLHISKVDNTEAFSPLDTLYSTNEKA